MAVHETGDQDSRTIKLDEALSILKAGYLKEIPIQQMVNLGHDEDLLMIAIRHHTLVFYTNNSHIGDKHPISYLNKMLDKVTNWSRTNSLGQTIFHVLAVASIKKEIIQAVFTSQEKVKSPCTWLNHKCDRGYTPLSEALFYKNDTLVMELLKYKEVTIENQFLIIAVKKKFKDGLEQLLKALPNKSSSESREPALNEALTTAIQQRWSEGVSLLLNIDNRFWAKDLATIPDLPKRLAKSGNLTIFETVLSLCGDQARQKAMREDYLGEISHSVLSTVLKHRPNESAILYLGTHLHMAIECKNENLVATILSTMNQPMSKYSREEKLRILRFERPLESADDLQITPLARAMDSYISNPLLDQLINSEKSIIHHEDICIRHAELNRRMPSIRKLLKCNKDSESKLDNETLNKYFEYMKHQPIYKRVEEMEHKEEYLRWHRFQATTSHNLNVVKEITAALKQCQSKDVKSNIVHPTGSVDHCLDIAIKANKREIVHELLYQESLVHDEKSDGMTCLRSQLCHVKGLKDFITTFESFYPPTTTSVCCKFFLSTFLIGFIIIGLEVYDMVQDIQLIQFYAERIDEDHLEARHNVAFWVTFGSQILVLVTTVPVWFSYPIKVLPQKYKDWKEMSPRIPTLHEFHVWCEHVLLGLIIVVPFIMAVIGLVHPGLKDPYVSIATSGTMFSVATVVLVTLNCLLTELFIDLVPDVEKTALRDQLHQSQRIKVLVSVTVAGIESSMQLGLQIWLLSLDANLDKLNWGVMRAMYEAVSMRLFSPEEAQGNESVQKIIVAFLSLTTSTSMTYKAMKQNSMGTIDLVFIFLSLSCQILARLNAISFAFVNSSGLWSIQLLLVGGYLFANFFCVAVLKIYLEWDQLRKLDTLGNKLGAGLSVATSGFVLMRIPSDKEDEPIQSPTFYLQLLYFTLAFGLNSCLIMSPKFCPKLDTAVGSTYLVNLGLSSLGWICHCLYYKVFGHPWKATNATGMWANLKKIPKKLRHRSDNQTELRLKSTTDGNFDQSAVPILPPRPEPSSS